MPTSGGLLGRIAGTVLDVSRGNPLTIAQQQIQERFGLSKENIERGYVNPGGGPTGFLFGLLGKGAAAVQPVTNVLAQVEPIAAPLAIPARTIGGVVNRFVFGNNQPAPLRNPLPSLPPGGLPTKKPWPTLLPPGSNSNPVGPMLPPGYSNPLAPPGAIPPFPGSTGGGLPGIGSLCSLIPDSRLRLACEVGTGLLNPGGGGGLSASTCPPGYKSDGKGGCVTTGIGQYLPGDVGMPDTGWTPTAGLYGVGVSPLPVQRVVRACPPGFVLGKDGVCYDHLPRTRRAHNPGAKPLLTGGDMNALRRAKALQKTIGKLARAHGKPRKPCGCKPGKKR